MFSFVRPFVLTGVLLGGVFCPRGASCAPEARSPLGATQPEIVGRYGPVLRHNARVRHHQVLEGGTVLDGDLHGKNGYVIRVVYHQYHAVLLEFTRAAGEMSVADVNGLLAECGNNSAWEPGKDSTEKSKFYHRADHRAVAHWDVDEASLLIATEGDNDAGDLMDRLLQ